MPRPDNPLPTQLQRDLAELKLLEIARCYREVLDEAARKGSSMLEVLATLIGMEQTIRQQRALERRLRQARLPKQKTCRCSPLVRARSPRGCARPRDRGTWPTAS